MPKNTPVSYYIHPVKGNDANPGTSLEKPFQTLSQIGKLHLNPGDKIFLAANEEYEGNLRLVNQQGDPGNPITITSIDWNANQKNLPALINFKGRSIGILIQDCSYIQVSNLRLTGNGFGTSNEKSALRSAVLVNNMNDPDMNHIQLDHLSIKDVYY
ncbi:MAG: right-handed parallel beta-helix repeat-containing protein, partial [Bacteroidota bacterium]|nr:right-handed parallel beta-helix repeat-containing protein [Bacteroidota bacterium]